MVGVWTNEERVKTGGKSIAAGLYSTECIHTVWIVEQAYGQKLWNSGRSAHLGLHCHAGEAWVELHAQLGGPHQYHGFHRQPTPKRVSPSRDRRRARRAAARSKRTEENREKHY